MFRLYLYTLGISRDHKLQLALDRYDEVYTPRKPQPENERFIFAMS